MAAPEAVAKGFAPFLAVAQFESVLHVYTKSKVRLRAAGCGAGAARPAPPSPHRRPPPARPQLPLFLRRSLSYANAAQRPAHAEKT
jgi:hypothetical protein